MSTKFFALVCLLVIVSSVAFDQETKDRKCVAGKRFYDGCNWCSCSRTGIPFCTLMTCTMIDPETGGMVMMKLLDPPEDFWEKS
ncbi:serine protease inhibitor 3-like isoform X1 [Ptiloglossa arizonensis]|uniref:serine protease inhibitor 3-like isoform X1 n=1 Tax=Ptiloglossa arizonensis TaxID=3350558 RepID=UPI003FA014A2